MRCVAVGLSVLWFAGYLSIANDSHAPMLILPFSDYSAVTLSLETTFAHRLNMVNITVKKLQFCLTVRITPILL